MKKQILSASIAVLLGLCPVWSEDMTAMSATAVPVYKVLKVFAGKNIEYRFYCNGKHFTSAIMDPHAALAIRPHPGNDANGWGSTWYPEPFLPGATLHGTNATFSVVAGKYIALRATGVVSKGTTSNIGAWSEALNFTFTPSNKKVSATGTYSITLSSNLSSATGDLNICKIASNYLQNVPLLSGSVGDTGDMKNCYVVADNDSYVWEPTVNPGFFPQERVDNLAMVVVGQHNIVNTRAQGYTAIKSAYKPTMQVNYALRRPGNSFGMIPQTVLTDIFSGTKMNASLWKIPTWQGNGDGTWVGQTQFRCSQNYGLPPVSNGSAKVLLETYNPTGDSFYGTDLIAKPKITLGQGVLVTVVAKAISPFPGGIVGGIFLYCMKPDGYNHDEVDFELMSNHPSVLNTNIYCNEPLGAGQPIVYAFPYGSALTYHTYQILWLPGGVYWYIDGRLMRSVTNSSMIPKGPMYLHLNMWVPDSGWTEAYNAGLKYTDDDRKNKVYSMAVDSATVQALQTSPMIFGAMFNQSQSRQYWADNIGITPLLLRSTTFKSFNFSVGFQSTAILGDH